MQGTMQYLLQSRSGIGTGTVVAVAEPLVTNLGNVISYRRPHVQFLVDLNVLFFHHAPSSPL